MTTIHATSGINAAIALLNVVGEQFRKKKATDSQKRILADIVEVQHGLIGAQNLLVYLQREHDRMVSEHPVTFATGEMVTAIEVEVREAQ